MLDKIVISSDHKTATVICDDKTFTLYHSDGNVMLLVNEMILEPMAMRERCGEVTELIDIQLVFDLSA